MKLEVNNLKKNYGAKEALKGVSFTLTNGVYGLLGPNGSGKSTLMNILTGNLKATDGEVLCDNQEIGEMGIKYRELVGYMPQQQALYPDFTAMQFLSYIAALRGMKKKYAKERISYALDAVELSDVREKRIKTLSGGMKQRLLIAQAILDDPKLLIMDEPSAGLDPKQRVEMRNLISSLAKDKTVLISTHVVSDIDDISKEILLLRNGELIKSGTKNELFEEAAPHIEKPVKVNTYDIDLEDIYLYYFGE